MNVEQWQKLSLFQQLGNIGSEISRAFSWEQKNDLQSRNLALARSLELLDLTLNQNKLTELSTLRKVISDLIVDGKNYNVNLAQVKDYCLKFALAARSHK